MEELQKSKKEITVSLEKAIWVAAVIVALLIGIAIGAIYYSNTSTIHFADSDKNFLVGLAYTQGFCERQGLNSTVVIQKDSNSLVGIPVCVQKVSK